MAESVIKSSGDVLLTGTLGSSEGAAVTVNYPSGFSQNNCIVESAMYYNDSYSYWGTFVTNNQARFDVELRTNGINIIVRLASVANKPFKILLKKV